MYEFDLESYFNRINTQLISSRLDDLIPGLGKWIKAITHNTTTIMREYHPEKEVLKIGDRNGKPIYAKWGYTQGSSYISNNLNMSYAKARIAGIHIAKYKPHGWVENKVTFLGITFDTMRKKVQLEIRK